MTSGWEPTSTADGLVFRRADAGDLPAIIDLLHDDELGATRNPPFEGAEAAYLSAFTRLTGPDNGEIVAVRDGTVIGCYQLTFIAGLSFSGGERAMIESVRIGSALRGGGLGTLLMRDAIRRAEARGCVLVQLTTDVRRDHTRRFYERLGFSASHHGMKLAMHRRP